MADVGAAAIDGGDSAHEGSRFTWDRRAAMLPRVDELSQAAVQSGTAAESNSPFRTPEQFAHRSTRNRLQPGTLRRRQKIFNDGRGLTFPCDAVGHVDLDGLSERARPNYFYARTFIGREFFLPSIRPLEH